MVVPAEKHTQDGHSAETGESHWPGSDIPTEDTRKHQPRQSDGKPETGCANANSDTVTAHLDTVTAHP